MADRTVRLFVQDENANTNIEECWDLSASGCVSQIEEFFKIHIQASNWFVLPQYFRQQDYTVAVHIYDPPGKNKIAYVHPIRLKIVAALQHPRTLWLLINRFGHLYHFFGWLALDIKSTTNTMSFGDKIICSLLDDKVTKQKTLEYSTTQLSDDWINVISSCRCGTFSQLSRVDAPLSPGGGGDDGFDPMDQDDNFDAPGERFRSSQEIVDKNDDEEAALLPTVAKRPKFEHDTLEQTLGRLLAIFQTYIDSFNADELIARSPRTLKQSLLTSGTTATFDPLVVLLWLLYPKSHWSRANLLLLARSLMPTEVKEVLGRAGSPEPIATSWLAVYDALVEQLFFSSTSVAHQLILAHPLTAIRQWTLGIDRRLLIRRLSFFHDFQLAMCDMTLAGYQALLQTAQVAALAKQTKEEFYLLRPRQTEASPFISLLAEIAECPGFNDYLNKAPLAVALPQNTTQAAVGTLRLLAADLERAPRCVRDLVDALVNSPDHKLSHGDMNVLVPLIYSFWRRQPGCSGEQAMALVMQWFAQQGAPIYPASERPPGVKADDFPCKAHHYLKKLSLMPPTVVDKKDGKVYPNTYMENGCRKIISSKGVMGNGTCSACPFQQEMHLTSTTHSMKDIEDLSIGMCLAQMGVNGANLTSHRPSLHWRLASVGGAVIYV